MKKISNLLYLQLSIIVYSISTIPSKLASNQSIMSFKFYLYYVLVIFILGIYAILWQQILKKFPLFIAFANKASSIIWCMFVGFVIFNEEITLLNIVGAIIVVVGIIIMVKGEHENE